MSKGSITNSIIDGALGSQSADATGVFCAVGVAAVPNVSVQTFADPEKAGEALGDGPLRDLVVSALGIAGATCYVVALNGSVAGTLGAVTASADNAGAGSLAAAGSPRNEYDIEIVIDSEGGLNEATFHYVKDGIQSAVMTVPESGGYAIPDTGITITFTGGTPAEGEESFAEGDSWSFACTEPSASNAEILAAVDTLINSGKTFEWISIAGVSAAALWAALDAKAAGAEKEGKYFYFKCQARYLDDGETVDEWVNALTGSERGTTSSTRVQVYAGWIMESDAYGAEDIRGCIGLGTGMSARRDVHEPVDATKYGSVPGVVSLMPEGINDGHINALDNAGFTTFCTYPGQTGVYVTHGRMTAPETSDFTLEERRRVMDYALRKIQKAQFMYINDTVEIGADGSLEGIDMFKAVSENPLRIMKNSGKISDGEVLIDEDQNILSTETIKTRVRITPLGKMTFIENTISFYNPSLSEE